MNGRKLTKDELSAEIARAVGAGKPVAIETVDFADPNRPKVCLEVDFPILPINQVAAIEGNAGKPIYQMSKWWARRRSSVFRSMLISAAMKAPDDPADAAKVVWDAYYNNHQKKGALKHLKVADIFMGGGTTIVEGSRLGMQMFGVDLNPVAWFVVKNEMAKVDRAEVEALLAAVETEVKPQIMPFYACDCPRGHKGTWTKLSSGKVMGQDFDPLALTSEERPDYRYEGPEIIYVFWGKHGPCQVTGCGHRTPIMSSPVMAVKALTVKAWTNYRCAECREKFDVEATDARMAPGVPLVVAESEAPFAVLNRKGVKCPHCGHQDKFPRLAEKAEKKKVDLTLLVHPEWLAGESRYAPDETEYGGSVTDSAEGTAKWYAARTKKMRLVEVRGELPEEVTCPETKVRFKTSVGTVPKRSTFACAACGTQQDVLEAVKASGKTGSFAPYATQGYCPSCDDDGAALGGRFFMIPSDQRFSSGEREWQRRRHQDLEHYWPKSAIIPGAEIGPHDVEGHRYTHWWAMFNARQLLVLSQLLQAILHAGGDGISWPTREYLLAAFQQYLRNQNMFSFWNLQRDTLEPLFSNPTYHPKSTAVENSVFSRLGRGNWQSSSSSLLETADWWNDPWELVAREEIERILPEAASALTGKSEKARPGDGPGSRAADLLCQSSTDLEGILTSSIDSVITDPPFSGLLQYAELADFFYVWLRLGLKDKYPDLFSPEYVPKALEVVENTARQPENAKGFYKRLLTQCWREAHRILKPGGLLAFTFHHSEDEPWVAVLESLFDAGFVLEATYPIRGDETKGDTAQFGSQKIEYDIIHVCRKRTEEPTAVSWARMRRQVLKDVKQLQQVLEHHSKAGLPAADLQVIKRGKALEYYSRHYGRVFVDEGRDFSVREALVGINQLLDEEAGGVKEAPPVNAEPFTRQFLRLFDGRDSLERDQIQKFLRGTGVTPQEFVDRGWCTEERKIYHVVPPRTIAMEWYGKHRRNLVSDYDQAAVLIGASSDGSGINVRDTLNNDNFRPHPALKSLLEWHTTHGSKTEIRSASIRALAIYEAWEQENPEKTKQLAFFNE